MIEGTEEDLSNMPISQKLNFSTTFSLPSSTTIKAEDSSSSLIWVILFSGLIILSFCTNLILVLAVLSNPRKRTGVHLILCLLFILNLVDYSLLILEFSTGATSHFPWGDVTCTVYQFVLQANPIFGAALLCLMVYTALCTQNRGSASLCWSMGALLPFLLLLSLPSLLYSDTAVYPSGARYCVLDLNGVAAWMGMEVAKWQSLTALYYLMYRCVLPYLLPLLVCIKPMTILYKRIYGPEDKNCAVSLSLAVLASHFVFYSCCTAVVFIRYTVEMFGLDVSGQYSWILAVLECLFTLLASFQHVFRPMLCFVLDYDLRKDFLIKLRGRKVNMYQAVLQTSSQMV